MISPYAPSMTSARLREGWRVSDSCDQLSRSCTCSLAVVLQGWDALLKNPDPVPQQTRTLSTASPNSRLRTPPLSAMRIRADARACTPARDGGLRGKACSTAFPDQPARAEPTRHL